MTREEALPIARKIAAAVCELDNCPDDYVQYVRDGSFDEQREVKAALAAVQFTAEHIARQRRNSDKSNVVEMAA